MITFYFGIVIVLFAALAFLSRNRSLSLAVSILSMIALWIYAIYAWRHLGDRDSEYFQFDAIGIILTVLLAIVSSAGIYQSYLYLKRHKGTPRADSIYYGCYMLLSGILAVTYFAQHLGLMWALMESTTLLVGLLIYHERQNIHLEAAWKYLFICSIGITLAFAGILYLGLAVSESGLKSLNFTSMKAASPYMVPLWLKISFGLILSGFSCKLGSFPFQTVSIDAHAAAPPPVNAVMGTALKNVGLLAVIRMMSVVTLTAVASWASNVLILMGIISIAVAALELSRVKFFPRMLGYSSTEHIGLILIALGIGGIGYYAAILHIIYHTLVKAGFFLQLGQVHNYFLSNRISRCGSYMKHNPVGGIILILAVLSASAMPPSGMFFSEMMAFKAMFSTGKVWLTFLILGLLTLVIYYMFTYILHLLYDQDPEIKPLTGVELNFAESVPHFMLIMAAVVLGFWMPDELHFMISDALKLFI